MKKKICLVDFDDSVCGGVEKVTANLANALADYYEVHVVSIAMEADRPAFPLDERIRFHVLCEKPDRLRYLRKAAKKRFPAYMRENGIDTVILQGNYAGYVVGTVCAKKGAKTAFFDHGALMNQWERKDIRFIRWLCAKKCDYVITLTEKSRNDYMERFHLSKDRVKCFYNWIDDTVPPAKEYNADSTRIISAGRFTYEKGFDHLVKIFAPVAKKFPQWHLDLYGDGEERGKIEALIREYGAAGNIHLCGIVDDLDRRYGDYAMYVLPSYREGMPLVLLEAKYNRLPIVSFDIDTGPREIVTDGVNGILVAPYETEKMSEAIGKLIENRELRAGMSAHAYDDLDRFSKETILKQWIEFLEGRENAGENGR